MKDNKNIFYSSSGGGFYALGFIGALIYYFQNAIVFTDYIWGFVKALLWPGFLVYQAFVELGM